MSWDIKYLKEAKKDMAKLDPSQRDKVIKAVRKAAQNPLPVNEGGYGHPLSNNKETKLAGLLKIKLRGEGLRVVYKVIRQGEKLVVIIVDVREDSKVYKEAERRRKKYNL